MFRKMLILIFGMLIVFNITSCADNNNYEKFTQEFNKSYLSVANSINIKDTSATLKAIQSDENKKEISKMKSLLENIKDNVPDNMKRHYKNLKNWYNGLAYVEESAPKWDSLSGDERWRIQSELVLADMRKDNLKENK